MAMSSTSSALKRIGSIKSSVSRPDYSRISLEVKVPSSQRIKQNDARGVDREERHRVPSEFQGSFAFCPADYGRYGDRGHYNRRETGYRVVCGDVVQKRAFCVENIVYRDD